MDRLQNILKYADLTGKGIEIAPYFNPIVTKRDGHNVLILDVFDTEVLLEKAQEDPLIPNERVKEIEAVDIVGDASHLATLCADMKIVNTIDYIVSSHNFEHLPNPIQFLRGVEKVLKPGGVLSMAVPDYRACFDHFRMPTRLSDWLDAYHEGRSQPTPGLLFDFAANTATYEKDGIVATGCNIASDSPAYFKIGNGMKKAYADYVHRKSNQGGYVDAHCTVVFPEIMELFLIDLKHLGLIDMDIIEVSQTAGLEFFVHIRKPKVSTIDSDEEYYEKRAHLLRQISQNLGAGPFGDNGAPISELLKRRVKVGLRKPARVLRDAGRVLRGKKS